MKLSVHLESWSAKTPFRITGREYSEFEVLVVELLDGDHVGRGEARGVRYLDDQPVAMARTVERNRDIIESGIDRRQLMDLLPPGGARNALDCALWDLEAKRTGRSVWQLTGVDPVSVQSAYSIGIEPSPYAMGARAEAAADFTLLKIKLDGRQPLDRMRAVRSARPDARIVVDVNQGWSFDQLRFLAPAFAELGVELIEQPLPRGQDHVLDTYDSPVPLCADESCQHLGELDAVSDGYRMVNVKLDKCGGLTHALELVQATRDRGLEIMAGCMGGTSLAMVPALVVGCLADLADVDGPLLLKNDRPSGLRYECGHVDPRSGHWGQPSPQGSARRPAGRG